MYHSRKADKLSDVAMKDLYGCEWLLFQIQIDNLIKAEDEVTRRREMTKVICEIVRGEPSPSIIYWIRVPTRKFGDDRNVVFYRALIGDIRGELSPGTVAVNDSLSVSKTNKLFSLKPTHQLVIFDLSFHHYETVHIDFDLLKLLKSTGPVPRFIDGGQLKYPRCEVKTMTPKHILIMATFDKPQQFVDPLLFQYLFTHSST